MDGLYSLAALGTGIALWLGRARAREQALRTTARACEAMGVKLLDEAVAPKGLTLRRDPSGRLRLRRRYVFEFTADGHQRHPGWTFLLGARTEAVHFGFPEGTTVLGPQAIPARSQQPPAPPGNPSSSCGGPSCRGC